MDLTNKQIDNRLVELPAEIAKLADKARVAEEELRGLEATYERDYNREYLESKAKLTAAGEKPTVKDLEAGAFNALYPMKMEIISKEAEVRKWKIKTEEAARKMDALRSLIKLRVAEMENIDG